jgi:hypothetical protein
MYIPIIPGSKFGVRRAGAGWLAGSLLPHKIMEMVDIPAAL